MTDDLSVCRNVAMSFFRHLDDRDYLRLTQLMTTDASWYRQGEHLMGHSGIHDALLKRSPTMRIHHLITNLVADELKNDLCRMRAYMLVVRHDGSASIMGPAPLSGIENIRTTHIILKRFDDTWLIAQVSNDEPSFAVTA